MRVTLLAAFLALAGCASQSQLSDDAASFDGQKMPKIGQTKQEVESVWGKPDRSRVNSDGSSAELFVPDKWKFAAPFYVFTGWQPACMRWWSSLALMVELNPGN
jgi:hypothetical protein